MFKPKNKVPVGINFLFSLFCPSIFKINTPIFISFSLSLQGFAFCCYMKYDLHITHNQATGQC
jgi:hypothetical protein